VCIPLSLLGNGSVNTFPWRRRIVGSIVLCAVCAVSKEGRLVVLLRTSCYFMHCTRFPSTLDVNHGRRRLRSRHSRPSSYCEVGEWYFLYLIGVPFSFLSRILLVATLISGLLELIPSCILILSRSLYFFCIWSILTYMPVEIVDLIFPQNQKLNFQCRKTASNEDQRQKTCISSQDGTIQT
jgi:hypothetical protein